MKSQFQPKLSILPAAQRRLWAELSDVPSSFVLCGGTAIALHLGHRSSVDFDFFAPHGFDPDVLFDQIGFLRDSKPIQKSANTLTCAVDRGGIINVSFFGTPSMRLINPPTVSSDNDVRIASLLDLAGMKAAVVQKRPEAKDYIDLDAIIEQTGIGLPTALAAAKLLYGAKFNPALTLKSLCFYGDGNLYDVPPEAQGRLVAAVKNVDANALPSIDRP